MLSFYLFLLSLTLVEANTSTEICHLVNAIRSRYGVTPSLVHSNAMRRTAQIHLENLLAANYDPFAGNICDPHSWFENSTLGIQDCCYPQEECMGQRANQLTGYTGISIENFHAMRRNGGFFGGQITSSGITPESAVNGWENSEGHLRAMLSSQKVCGAAILEYRTDLNPNMYHYTGMAALWMGNQLESDSNFPTAQPSSYPTHFPTAQPSSHPTPIPTLQPSNYPTPIPTSQPSNFPSAVPTRPPSTMPDNEFPTISTQNSTSTSTSTSTVSTTSFTAIPPSTCDCDDYYSVGAMFFVASLFFCIGGLLATVASFSAHYIYRQRKRAAAAHAQKLAQIELQPPRKRKRHLRDVVREVMDPDNSEDAEVLQAGSSREMLLTLKRQRERQDSQSPPH